MPRRRTLLIAALLALVVLTSACTETDDDTGGTGGGADDGGVTLPSGAAGTGNLSTGSAHFVLSGDVEAERTLDTLTTAIWTPGDGMALTIEGDASTDMFGIGGPAIAGTQRTRTNLSLSVMIDQGQTELPLAFVSFAGECEVDITDASESSVAGSFRCTGLSDGTGEVTVDVVGEFSASG